MAHSIRAWRLYRGLTLDALAARLRHAGVPITPASLSRVERGIHPYEQRKLEAIAAALEAEPADLVAPAPPSADDVELRALWNRLGPDARRKALQMLKVLSD